VLQSLFSLKIQGLKGVDNISIFAKIGMIFGLQGLARSPQLEEEENWPEIGQKLALTRVRILFNLQPL
jgi:hypothetical protein